MSRPRLLFCFSIAGSDPTTSTTPPRPSIRHFLWVSDESTVLTAGSWPTSARLVSSLKDFPILVKDSLIFGSTLCQVRETSPGEMTPHDKHLVVSERSSSLAVSRAAVVSSCRIISNGLIFVGVLFRPVTLISAGIAAEFPSPNFLRRRLRALRFPTGLFSVQHASSE